jgi:4-hydroxythreonine-4-phosphate dehydrogenase
MGDPAGVGPEIIVKALREQRVHDLCLPIVIGDPGCMKRAVEEIVKVPMEINVIAAPAEARGEFGVIDVLPIAAAPLDALPLGKVDARCGDAAFRSVETVIRLALRGELDGTVTAPLNKEAMNLAGHHFDGHTEIYATLTGVKQYAMMLADGKLRVVHVSTHIPLSQASSRITFARVLDVIRLGNDACKKIGIPTPRVGVAGFNPHAGENGLFGTEEQEHITPAIVAARNEGIDVAGPLSPDTVFSKAAGGAFDIVVAMYHDQGHIPLKMLGFHYDDATGAWSGMTGVNITLGLPIVRASVDHGTAFGKAGKNAASPLSMIHAVEYGAMLAGTSRA